MDKLPNNNGEAIKIIAVNNITKKLNFEVYKII